MVVLVTIGMAAIQVRVGPGPGGLWPPIPALRVRSPPTTIVRVLRETVVVVQVGELVHPVWVVVGELGAGGVVEGVFKVRVVGEGHGMGGATGLQRRGGIRE